MEITDFLKNSLTGPQCGDDRDRTRRAATLIPLLKYPARLLLIGICASFVQAATYQIYPDGHSRVFSAHETPVLRLHSGDTVVTKTWDSGGQDDKGVRHLQQPYVYPETGNPLMGPFYIEEADRGDALEVHLDKVRLNRNWGYTSYRLSPDILTSGAAEQLYKNFYKMEAVRPGSANLIPWDLDLKRNVANPRLLSSSGFKFDLPVKPMLGCIGVATPGDEVLTSGPAGSYGGNMDYNDVAEGATLDFPVYHKGAYFYLGDGHALQGDGEGLGTGIETSMDVQFTVRVLKGKNLTQPETGQRRLPHFDWEPAGIPQQHGFCLARRQRGHAALAHDRV